MHFEHSGSVISDMVDVISAEDCFESKPVDPIRHVACGSGGGDKDVDLCPVGESPCRVGVDGFLEEGCDPGGCLSHNPEAAIGYAASLGHGPEGAVGPNSNQFSAQFSCRPGCVITSRQTVFVATAAVWTARFLFAGPP